MRPLTRRVLFATIALVVGCYYMLVRLPVDRQVFFGYIATFAVIVLGLVAAAFVLVAVIKVLGRWFGRR